MGCSKLNILKQSDINSQTWKRIKDHVEQRIEMLRRKNDSNLDEIETAKIRGQIAELKFIAELDKPAPQLGEDAHIL